MFFLRTLPIAIVVFGVCFDLWTKHLAQQHLSMYAPLEIIPKILSFQLVYNYGAAYGIFQGKKIFLLSVTLLFIVGAFFFRHKIITSMWSRYGLAFIYVGALGNFLDRFMLGYVRDFIDIRIFPLFNIADISINIGVGCFLVEMGVSYLENRRQSK